MRLTTYLLAAAVSLPAVCAAQTFDFDMTASQPQYTDQTGYGYESDRSADHCYFSVKVPDGNYKVRVELGAKKHAAVTTVRAESRRLFVDRAATKRGHYATYEFVVNKRSPYITDSKSVKINQREQGSFTWDDRLTLEFCGQQPAVRSIHIERDDVCPTVYLCGNSTVVDQAKEPWASWGQMLPRWFNENIAIANHAESGLRAGSFIEQNRLEKIKQTLRKGDYVICEFGHNDEKERQPGSGAWYSYSRNLKVFVDEVRKAGATLIFCSPTRRRSFDQSGKLVNTHGDFPAAMFAVAEREGVPVIDLHEMTRQFFEALGVEGSKRALVHYPANTFPGQDKALADNTHFNPYGASEVAKMVVMGMKKLDLPILQNLRSDFTPFDPQQPDDPDTFQWVASSKVDFVKPAGN